ncbi:hypothetical protein RCL_jg21172.t1 [Rhizophagus clarus]|uniref:Uncharacterized protein n=1 Tax=Rhizophagus clarus TaxID=94130 RepID=A0A8H3LWT3_9GLOM|nr:hypothetical protein RCL_jg21172.t1 [Rhizophagus clarus]
MDDKAKLGRNITKLLQNIRVAEININSVFKKTTYVSYDEFGDQKFLLHSVSKSTTLTSTPINTIYQK